MEKQGLNIKAKEVPLPMLEISQECQANNHKVYLENLTQKTCTRFRFFTSVSMNPYETWLPNSVGHDRSSQHKHPLPICVCDYLVPRHACEGLY